MKQYNQQLCISSISPIHFLIFLYVFYWFRHFHYFPNDSIRFHSYRMTKTIELLLFYLFCCWFNFCFSCNDLLILFLFVFQVILLRCFISAVYFKPVVYIPACLSFRPFVLLPILILHAPQLFPPLFLCIF